MNKVKEGMDTIVFNEKELLLYTEEDAALSAELLRMAVTDIPDFLRSAREAREEGAAEEAAEFLHKIKGIAGCIGAVRVQTLSAEMEEALKTRRSLSLFDRKIGDLEEAVSDFSRDRDVRRYVN